MVRVFTNRLQNFNGHFFFTQMMVLKVLNLENEQHKCGVITEVLCCRGNFGGRLFICEDYNELSNASF